MAAATGSDRHFTNPAEGKAGVRAQDEGRDRRGDEEGKNCQVGGGAWAWGAAEEKCRAVRSGAWSVVEVAYVADTSVRDATVYTGLAGAALVALHCARDGMRGMGAVARAVAKRARSVLLASGPGRRITFHEGSPGVWAVSAVVEHVVGRPKKSPAYVTELVDFAAARMADADSNELLYGRAGLLFALLFVRAHGVDGIPDDVVTQLAQLIYADGVGGAQAFAALQSDDDDDSDDDNAAARCPPLMYVWHKKRYLGAAHGLAGILYVLLHSGRALDRSQRKVVRAAIRWLAGAALASGNHTSSMGKDKDTLVQWCHGAPGMVHLFADAAEVYNDDSLAAAALASGAVIWRRGLLRKAPGLCHGLAGNGFGLLRLYDMTGDDAWLARARAFAVFSGTLEFQDGHFESDAPASLYGGDGGLAAFVSAALSPRTARFPGYDLRPIADL